MLSRYYTPTRVVLGENAESEVVSELQKEKATRVLVVFGGKSAEKSGLLCRIRTLLSDAGIVYFELGGVQPNPHIELAREGVRMARENEADFILAIGGGSVIDTAKAIAYALFSNCDPWDFYSGKLVPTGSVGVGVILTLAAAGSEMSDSSVLTNAEFGLKRGCNSDFCRVRFTLEDPALTLTVPPFQTACGTVDIMMHTLERFFHGGKSFELTDELAYALLGTVMKSGSDLMADPSDMEARKNIMWASSLSHNGLMATGNPNKGDWACHQLEHELSGMFDIAHAEGLSIVFPAWLKYVSADKPGRVAELGRHLFGLCGDDDKIVAEGTIRKFEQFFCSLKMPLTLSEIGIEIDDARMSELLDKATFYGKRTLGAYMVLHREDMKAIYELCR